MDSESETLSIENEISDYGEKVNSYLRGETSLYPRYVPSSSKPIKIIPSNLIPRYDDDILGMESGDQQTHPLNRSSHLLRIANDALKTDLSIGKRRATKQTFFRPYQRSDGNGGQEDQTTTQKINDEKEHESNHLSDNFQPVEKVNIGTVTEGVSSKGADDLKLGDRLRDVEEGLNSLAQITHSDLTMMRRALDNVNVWASDTRLDHNPLVKDDSGAKRSRVSLVGSGLLGLLWNTRGDVLRLLVLILLFLLMPKLLVPAIKDQFTDLINHVN